MDGGKKEGGNNKLKMQYTQPINISKKYAVLESLLTAETISIKSIDKIDVQLQASTATTISS